jgi:hypothetical protein
MSKAGSLARIKIYKKHGNEKLLKKEEEYYNKTYGVSKIKEEVKEIPKVEKVKKSK